jgi:c-di-GMP-binding flagellar brake protein YcgR
MARENSGTSDRRHSNRVHVEARLRLFAYRDAERVAFSGQVNDISEVGLSVFVSAEFEVGDTVEVEVALPYSTGCTRAKAIVRTRDNYRYGLQFVDLHPKQQEALARACKLIGLMKC